MPLGKYFFIRSRLHGLVLEIEDRSRDAGASVVPQETKGEANEHQQWYVDGMTSTVRSKLNDFCLDINDDSTLIVTPFKPGDGNQQFEVAGDRLSQRANSLNVVDIGEADEEPGARVCVYEYSGDDNQRWEFDYLEAQFFYMISELSGMVVDIARSDMSPGAKMHMWPKVPEPLDNQLWYEDKEGRIRTKLSEFLLDNSKGAKVIAVYPEEFGNPGQNWVRMHNRVVNKFNATICLEIKKKSKKKKAELMPAEYKGDKHQHWKFVFVGSSATHAFRTEDDFDDDDDDDDDDD